MPTLTPPPPNPCVLCLARRMPQGQFQKAVAIAGDAFETAVKYYGLAWLPARTVVEAALKRRHEVDPSGRIILLAESCPWKVP